MNMEQALVVEDSRTVAAILKHFLQREGFGVLVAPDGVVGLETARREQPRLIVTDLNMPGMGGLELVRALRADSRTTGAAIRSITCARLAANSSAGKISAPVKTGCPHGDDRNTRRARSSVTMPCRMVQEPGLAPALSERARGQGGLDSFLGERYLPQAYARSVKYRIPNRRGHERDGGLTRTRGFLVRTIDENGFDDRHVGTQRQTVVASPVD